MALRPRYQQALIEPALQVLRTSNPAFLWAPSSEAGLFRDEAGGVIGRPNSANTSVDFGGLVGPQSNSPNGIEFKTNAGITSAAKEFIGLMLVSVNDRTALRGALLKIGNSSSGIGFGAGSSDFDTSGSRLVTLQETIVWKPSSTTNDFAPGLNVLSFGRTNQSVIAYFNHTTGVGVDISTGVGSTVDPSSNIYVNGYSTNRGADSIVHCVAIFNKSLDNTQFPIERSRLAAEFAPYARSTRARWGNYGVQLFTPKRVMVPVSVGGGAASVGRSDETDTALTLSAKAIRATGLASETSTALALAGKQLRAVGRADETDSAFARVAVQIAATGRSDEADSAIARAAVQIKAAGRADETDSSLALTAKQIKLAGLASETDSAIARAPVQVRAVGMATETDSAFSLVAKQIGATGRADETDTAFARDAGSASQVGIANETDSAISRPAVQIAPVQMATESDTALALSAPVGGQAGLSVETDTALANGAVQIRPVGLAVEADAALALGIAIVRPVGMAAENDSAFALAGRHLRLVGMASETDTALALTPPVVAPVSATRGYTTRSSGVRRTARSEGITRTARRRSA